MKNLMDFSGSALSRTEMKSVKGGSTYICSCGKHAGTWSNNYKNYASAMASVGPNCRGGGSCYRV